MKRLIYATLCFTVQFAMSGARGKEWTVPQVLGRSVQPITSLRPLSERELKAKARGHFLTPIMRTTDQCAAHYDTAGTITCSAPMASYHGRYQVTGNKIITEVDGHKTVQAFFANPAGKLFSAFGNEKSAIEVMFYDTGRDLPDRFH
jgi:hypothetical protein